MKYALIGSLSVMLAATLYLTASSQPLNPVFTGSATSLSQDVLPDNSHGQLIARDAATGQATGKRQYQPIVIIKSTDKSSPMLQTPGSGDTTTPPSDTSNDGKRSFAPRLNSSGQVSEVTVRGWDPQHKKDIVGGASPSGNLAPQGGGGGGGSSPNNQGNEGAAVDAFSPNPNASSTHNNKGVEGAAVDMFTPNPNSSGQGAGPHNDKSTDGAAVDMFTPNPNSAGQGAGHNNKGTEGAAVDAFSPNPNAAGPGGGPMQTPTERKAGGNTGPIPIPYPNAVIGPNDNNDPNQHPGGFTGGVHPMNGFNTSGSPRGLPAVSGYKMTGGGGGIPGNLLPKNLPTTGGGNPQMLIPAVKPTSTHLNAGAANAITKTAPESHERKAGGTPPASLNFNAPALKH